MFSWIMEWVAIQSMPLTEVDNEITRKGICYHGAITSKLLRKTIFLLQSEVKTKIKEQLPNQLVLVFDGWTEGNEHFIGIHASYIDPISNLAIETLLSMQPLLAEGIKTMTAADRVCHITKTRTHYGKTVDNIVCLAGDTCPVNQSMARILGVPLLWCGLHKFNLAIKNWVVEQPVSPSN